MKKVACEPSMGADPEVFIMDHNERIVPCVGVLKGTKDKPWTPRWMNKGYALQEDNVMCEFNVKPAFNAGDGIDFMKYAIRSVRKALSEQNHIPRWGKVTHTFKAAQLTSKQARVFGCEADYDAYVGGAVRRAPQGLADTTKRSCGGHIHLGGDFKCPDFVAALFAELVFGVYCDGVADVAGSDDGRKAWYGAPGIFRPKPYGIEYRTPSNRWVSDSYARELYYQKGIELSEWLTNTRADALQRAFRAIPWVQQREFMQKGDDDLKQEILDTARGEGVPI